MVESFARAPDDGVVRRHADGARPAIVLVPIAPLGAHVRNDDRLAERLQVAELLDRDLLRQLRRFARGTARTGAPPASPARGAGRRGLLRSRAAEKNRDAAAVQHHREQDHDDR